MKIVSVHAREIFDSRARPTIECDIMLSSGEVVRSSVPSGLSKGSFEASELRDKERLDGFGVQTAINLINKELAPYLIGKEPDMIEIDQQLISLDGTLHKSRLGSNTLLALSMAVCRAQALSDGVQLYELIASLCNIREVSISCPMINIVGGGIHVGGSFPIQEVLLIPVKVPTFRSALELITIISNRFRTMLHERGYSVLVNDEGAFAPEMSDLSIIFDFLKMITIDLGVENNIVFALDVAATQLYDPIKKIYTLYERSYTFDELIAWYHELVNTYQLYALEDGLAESDTEGWQQLTKELGEQLLLVGDDLFVTDPARIVDGVQRETANAVIIKPNQIGTVTEALQSVLMCNEYELPFIISHRSGETNDSFIADMAVGTNAPLIKAGGCNHGERLAKYNRLLEIEDQLIAASVAP